MKKLILIAAAVGALALAGTAAAALVPWTFVGPGATCSPTSTFSGGVLHLSKPCTTATNASAGATITGVSGQTFTSASFTLANASQCQGGSPRFNVVTNVDDVLPRLQQRHADDQRERHGDLHVHRGDDRGGRQPGPRPDRHDLVGRGADRRPGHGRPEQHHVQRPEPGAAYRRPDLEEPVQARRLEVRSPRRRSRTRANA